MEMSCLVAKAEDEHGDISVAGRNLENKVGPVAELILVSELKRMSFRCFMMRQDFHQSGVFLLHVDTVCGISDRAPRRVSNCRRFWIENSASLTRTLCQVNQQSKSCAYASRFEADRTATQMGLPHAMENLDELDNSRKH